MKYLILLLVILVVGWLTIGRRRRRRPPDGGKPGPNAAPPQTPAETLPQAMLACVHCGIHLPQAEALQDAEGRAFCSEAHRLAGPR